MAEAVEKQSYPDHKKQLFAGLAALVQPPDREKSIRSVHASLQTNLSEAVAALGHQDLEQSLLPLIQCWGPLPEPAPNQGNGEEEDVSWKFVCVCLSALLELQTHLREDGLLSVQQKGLLKAALQFVSALGVGPLLQPGVGVPLESRCNAPVHFPKNNPQRLGYLLRGLLFLAEDKQTDLGASVTATLNLDILAALFQLSQDDKEFKLLSNKFVKSMHQPTVMRNLMMLLKPNPKTPKWFLVTTSSHLTKCLMAPDGVISTVRALHDVHTEQQLDKFAKTASIIMQPDMTKNPAYYKNLCPQVMQLLLSESEDYKKVAVQVVQRLHQKDQRFCQEQIFVPICTVFEQDFGDLEGNLILGLEQEGKIQSSVQSLLLLISHSEINPDCIVNHFPNICAFFLAIRKTGATPKLRDQTKDLMSKIIIQAEEPEMWRIICTLPEDCLESLSEDSAVAHSLFANFLKRFSTVEDLQEKVLLGSLLGALAALPSVQHQFMSSPTNQMIDLLKKLLEEDSPEILELTLLLVMAIISQNEDNLRKCQVLLPAVKKLRDRKEGSEQIRTVVEQIFTIIATFGAVSGDTLLLEQKLSTIFKEKQKIEEIPMKKPHPSGPTNLTFDEALEEVADEEIPVRGHGYLSLTKLIRRKIPEAKENQEELWKLGLAGMQHDDSYIYLASVGMMSALVLENLPLLQKLALAYNQKDLSTTVRNRIGESLLQVCKGLGELAASQRQILLNAYLLGAKDNDPTHRASSLSNLGEACKVLGYKVSSDLQEILMCAQDLSSYDPDMQVRRAAALLLALLLQGLGTEAVNTLGSSSLEVYRTMKQLAQNEDDTLRLQAHLALEEMSRGIKEGIFNPKPIEKKIYVTSVPP